MGQGQQALTGLVRDVRDLLLPRACVGCSADRHWWCPQCAQVAGDRVSVLRDPATGLFVASAHPYEPPVRDLVLAYKESGLLQLAHPLSELLSAAIVAHPDRRGSIALVPIPGRRESFRRRGAHVLLAVVRLSAAQIGLPVRRHLRLVSQPKQQKGLRGAQRADNVAATMVARRGGADAQRCLLVDDVITTGATVREGWRALRAAGHDVAGAASIAHRDVEPAHW